VAKYKLQSPIIVKVRSNVMYNTAYCFTFKDVYVSPLCFCLFRRHLMIELIWQSQSSIRPSKMFTYTICTS